MAWLDLARVCVVLDCRRFTVLHLAAMVAAGLDLHPVLAALPPRCPRGSARRVATITGLARWPAMCSMKRPRRPAGDPGRPRHGEQAWEGAIGRGDGF